MDLNDYYKILGLSENATEDEIKMAYKKLSLKYHPDRQVNKSDKEKTEAEKKFKEINEAYSILSEPDKRRDYDRFGNSNPRSDNWADFRKNFSSQGFNPFDFFEPFGRGEIVEPGTHIKMQIPLTIEDVFNGCTKKVKYERKVRCPNCHGAGGLNMKRCPHCHGSGQIESNIQTAFGYMTQTRTCPHCHGTGQISEKACPTCNGSGFKTDSAVIEVNFPPGMMNGFSIKFPGKGNESKSPKRSNGDFYAEATYSFKSDKYEVNGIDVIEKVYIPYYDILLGSTYELELPNHTKKKIIIPACAQEGKLLKLIGEGIKTQASTGDYYLEIHYLIPKTLSEDEKKALMKIKVKNIEKAK